jgi:hypothetical protein
MRTDRYFCTLLWLRSAATHTHCHAQFCVEQIELFGSYADQIVDFRVLPELLRINCAAVVVGKLRQTAQQQQQELYVVCAEYDATAAVPDIFVLNDQPAEHYSVLLPRAQLWASGQRLQLHTFARMSWRVTTGASPAAN